MAKKTATKTFLITLRPTKRNPEYTNAVVRSVFMSVNGRGDLVFANRSLNSSYYDQPSLIAAFAGGSWSDVLEKQSELQ